MTGMLQMLLLPFVRFMKRTIPRAAMLASTSGVALTFLSMGFAFQIWQDPPIAIGPLMLVIICYGSGVKLPYKIPVGLGALLLGTILAFTLYYTGAPTSVRCLLIYWTIFLMIVCSLLLLRNHILFKSIFIQFAINS